MSEDGSVVTAGGGDGGQGLEGWWIEWASGVVLGVLY